MKKTLVIFSMMLAMATLTGCGNTVRGAGADLERAGEKIQGCC
jgi:predicted small secreted protein